MVLINKEIEPYVQKEITEEENGDEASTITR